MQKFENKQNFKQDNKRKKELRKYHFMLRN